MKKKLKHGVLFEEFDPPRRSSADHFEDQKRTNYGTTGETVLDEESGGVRWRIKMHYPGYELWRDDEMIKEVDSLVNLFDLVIER